MKNKAVEMVQRIAGGMAMATSGKSRVFKNRKKTESKMKCRGKFKGDW